MKNKVGPISILIISTIPVLIWLIMFSLPARFGSASLIFKSFGQLLGLIGMVLFSLNIILSARLKFLEDYFQGLGKIYIDHHLIGAVALILLLFHPLSLSFVYLYSSAQTAASFLLPSVDRIDILWGSVALFLMTILLVLTFFIRPTYHIWKKTHQYLGLAFLFAFLHLMIIPSDVAQNPLLKNYLIILAILAFASIIYRVVLNNKLVARSPYVLEAVKKVNKDVFEIVLKPKNSNIKFLPGQFIFLKFLSDNLPAEEHPFSIASGKNDDFLKIVVKNLGDYTNKLINLKKDDICLIEGPFGRFVLKDKKDYLWIAGGIGITPFLSMARSLDKEINVTLYYCTKDNKEAVFLDELMDISNKNPNFKVFSWCSSEKGRISVDKIGQTDFDKKDIYICGQKPMMQSLRTQFKEKGIANDRIFTEEFEL